MSNFSFRSVYLFLNAFSVQCGASRATYYVRFPSVEHLFIECVGKSFFSFVFTNFYAKISCESNELNRFFVIGGHIVNICYFYSFIARCLAFEIVRELWRNVCRRFLSAGARTGCCSFTTEEIITTLATHISASGLIKIEINLFLAKWDDDVPNIYVYMWFLRLHRFVSLCINWLGMCKRAWK